METGGNGKALWEALLLGAAFILISVLILLLDAFDFIATWLGSHEDWELDEIVLILTLLAVCAGGYSFLRLRESRREMAMRHLAEARLQEANASLETKVMERTTQLRTTNEHLLEEIAERKAGEEQREALVDELRNALANVRQLTGILPICSCCKKIRDDSGYWQQVESYVREHSAAEFSHSLCPDCLKRLYPELEEEVLESASDGLDAGRGERMP